MNKKDFGYNTDCCCLTNEEIENHRIYKKTCVICKNQIADEKEYICSECYNNSLEELKKNEFYQKLKKNNVPIWAMRLMIGFAFTKDKGE